MCGEEYNALHDYIILGLPFNPLLSTCWPSAKTVARQDEPAAYLSGTQLSGSTGF